MADDANIQGLIEQGRLAEAAALLESNRQYSQAADLYEKLWDFAAAAHAAHSAGDLPRALGNHLRTSPKDPDSALLNEIISGSTDVQRQAAEVCVQRGALNTAAQLYASCQDLLTAAGLYRKSGLLLEAAELYERGGENKTALDLYRRYLQQAPNSELAKLGMGRMLCRYGQLAAAVPPLQQVVCNSGPAAGDATVGVVAALHRLGYPDAAKEALRLARGRLPNGTIPDSVTECLSDGDFAPLDADEEGGPVLAGRFRLGKLLGSGGMGRVYRANDQLEDRPVAVKVFMAPGGARGRDAFRRFVREALATGRLQHPHIVSLIDFNEEMGFLVLEFMGGGDLAQRLQPRMDPAICRTVLLQVLAGLGAAHQRGIVHRDIKPSNIFFTATGAAKLGDFGVAHLQDSAQTQTGGFIGTLAYMSPEQIRGDTITFATDIYSVGVTLFMMLTGRLPFSPPGLVDKHINEPVPLPTSVVPELPPLCDEIVVRCMAKAPTDRYESLGSLIHAIEKLPAEATTRTARADSNDQPAEHRRATDDRFAIEALTVDHPALQVLDARDNELGRPVQLVRVAPGPHIERLLSLLEAAARADEHLQRVLALDRQRGHAVIESWNDRVGVRRLQSSFSPGQNAGLQLCEQIATALAPLHANNHAHGQIAAESVYRCGENYVLGLTEALVTLVEAEAEAQPKPGEDLVALLELCNLRGQGADALADARALAKWAGQQRDQRRSQRQRDLLEQLLADAPDGVNRQ